MGNVRAMVSSIWYVRLLVGITCFSLLNAAIDRRCRACFPHRPSHCYTQLGQSGERPPRASLRHLLQPASCSHDERSVSSVLRASPISMIRSASMGTAAWNFGVQPYGDPWRKGRRLFQSGVHQSVVPKYQGLQTRSARLLLKQLRKNSNDLHASVRECVYMSYLDGLVLWPNFTVRHVGSTIIDVVYGIDSERKDYFISLADEAVRLFGQAAVPGAFLVDLIPARERPNEISYAKERKMTRPQSATSRVGSPGHRSRRLQSALYLLRNRCDSCPCRRSRRLWYVAAFKGVKPPQSYMRTCTVGRQSEPFDGDSASRGGLRGRQRHQRVRRGRRNGYCIWRHVVASSIHEPAMLTTWSNSWR